MPSIRPILPHDTTLLLEHLLRLDQESRALRFCRRISDEAITNYVRGIDWLSAVLLGHCEQGAIRAVGELRWSRPLASAPTLPEAAEIAVSVEKDWQDHGVGSDLVRRLALMAQNRGISHLSMVCLTANARMRAIVRHLNGATHFQGEEIQVDVELARPNHLTWMSEMLDHAGSIAGTLLDASNAMERERKQPTAAC
jgi:GNAT superfamily N-acetyltransferase